MAGEDENNRTDLHADPKPEPQKDAPLPAFIYGRNGHGEDGGRHRQSQNGRIAEMDRKTLLGLATGAGMLGLVLFFVGMLVGAGLFMDPDEQMAANEKPAGQAEIAEMVCTPSFHVLKSAHCRVPRRNVCNLLDWEEQFDS